MAATKLHADDTPVPVLAPGNGRTKTGRLWTYVRDSRPSADPTPPAVWFAYSPDRRGEHPQGHLKLYRGALQADAYAGFHPLYEDGSILEVACWAHARRKFPRDPYRARLAPPRPKPSSASPRSTPSKLRSAAVRRRSGRPFVRRGRGLCSTACEAGSNFTLAKLSRKSDTAAAIRYALSRWRALTRYLDDGELEIDNNTAERALRVVALGRKNFLFAGSNAGGERAAAIYSLLGTAKLNGHGPELYLHHVLERIADHPINRIGQLLPWNVTLPAHVCSH